MNYQKKCETQQKRINSLFRQIDKYKAENENLKRQNTELSDEVVRLKYQLTSVEETRKEYLQ